MSKLHYISYISYIQNQTVLFPQRIDEDIAENDPVRILNHIVEHLDLTHVKKLYREKGRLRVILFSITTARFPSAVRISRSMLFHSL